MFSLWLEAPAADKTEGTLSDFYGYAEQKYKRYCDDEPDIRDRMERKREKQITQFTEDGEFYLWTNLIRPVHDRISWDEVMDPFGDWRLETRPAIWRLAVELRDAAEQTRAVAEVPFDPVCWAEVWPIALCEFAIERGYSVEVVD